jgi:hypothetical protein
MQRGLREITLQERAIAREKSNISIAILEI